MNPNRLIHRHSHTGDLVTKEFAEENPGLVVSETIDIFADLLLTPAKCRTLMGREEVARLAASIGAAKPFAWIVEFASFPDFVVEIETDGEVREFDYFFQALEELYDIIGEEADPAHTPPVGV